MAHSVLTMSAGVNEDEFSTTLQLLETEALDILVAASNEFAVEVLKRARAVVPYARKGTGRKGHSPGYLQRSGRITNAIVTATEWQRTITFDTPYAHYQHTGMNRFTGYSTELQYSRSDRQANYLYQSGRRPGMKSPLEIVLRQGRIGQLLEA